MRQNLQNGRPLEPTPDPSDGERIYELMARFNEAAQGGNGNPRLCASMCKPLRDFFYNDNGR